MSEERLTNDTLLLIVRIDVISSENINANKCQQPARRSITLIELRCTARRELFTTLVFALSSADTRHAS